MHTLLLTLLLIISIEYTDAAIHTQSYYFYRSLTGYSVEFDDGATRVDTIPFTFTRALAANPIFKFVAITGFSTPISMAQFSVELSSVTKTGGDLVITAYPGTSMSSLQCFIFATYLTSFYSLPVNFTNHPDFYLFSSGDSSTSRTLYYDVSFAYNTELSNRRGYIAFNRISFNGTNSTYNLKYDEDSTKKSKIQFNLTLKSGNIDQLEGYAFVLSDEASGNMTMTENFINIADPILENPVESILNSVINYVAVGNAYTYKRTPGILVVMDSFILSDTYPSIYFNQYYGSNSNGFAGINLVTGAYQFVSVYKVKYVVILFCENDNDCTQNYNPAFQRKELELFSEGFDISRPRYGNLSMSLGLDHSFTNNPSFAGLSIKALYITDLTYLKVRLEGFGRNYVKFSVETDDNTVINNLIISMFVSSSRGFQIFYCNFTSHPYFTSTIGDPFQLEAWLEYAVPFTFYSGVMIGGYITGEIMITELVLANPGKICINTEFLYSNSSHAVFNISVCQGAMFVYLGGYAVLKSEIVFDYNFNSFNNKIMPPDTYPASKDYYYDSTSIARYQGTPYLIYFDGISSLNNALSPDANIHFRGSYLNVLIGADYRGTFKSYIQFFASTVISFHKFSIFTFCFRQQDCALASDLATAPDASIPQIVYFRGSFWNQAISYLLFAVDDANFRDNKLISFKNANTNNPRILGVYLGKNISLVDGYFNITNLPLLAVGTVTYILWQVSAGSDWRIYGLSNQDYYTFPVNYWNSYDLGFGTWAYSSTLSNTRNSYSTVLGMKFLFWENSLDFQCQVNLNFTGVLRGLFINNEFVMMGSSLDLSTPISYESTARPTFSGTTMNFFYIIGYRLTVISYEFVNCYDLANNPVTPSFTEFKIDGSPYQAYSFPYSTPALTCPPNCKICTSPTLCTQCSSGYYLDLGVCRTACDQADRVQILKDAYCERVRRNLGYRLSAPTFNAATNQSNLNYRLDFYKTYNTLMVMHLPYTISLTNVPWMNDFSAMAPLAQLEISFANPNSGIFNLAVSRNLEVTANYTNMNVSILIFDITQNYMMLASFNSSQDKWANQYTLVPSANKTIIQNYTAYSELFFVFTCSSSSCRFNLTFNGSLVFLHNERTVIFQASFSTIQAYEILRNFTNTFFIRIKVTDCAYLNLQIQGTYTTYAVNRFVLADSFTVPVRSCYIPGCINCVNNQYCLSCEQGVYLSSSMGRCLSSCQQIGNSTMWESRCMCLDNIYCQNAASSRCELSTGYCMSCVTDEDCSHLAQPGLGIFCNQGVCTNCGQDCQQCTNLTTCTKCPSSLVSYNGTCTLFCAPGIIKISNTECQDICGDGIRGTPGICDDGNLVDGDGCSSGCTIEYGYSCTGGGPNSSDVCNLIPVMKVTVKSSTEVLLAFNVNMTNMNVSDYFSLGVAGLKSSEISWTLSQLDDKNFILSVSLYKAVTNPRLQITLNPSLKSQDNVTVVQTTYSAFLPSVKTPALPAALKQTITAMQGTVSTASATVASSSAPSFLLGGNPALMWALINLLQIFYYLLFINVNYPSNLQAFFQIFSVGNLDFFPSPKSFMQSNITSEVSVSSPRRFDDHEINGSFIITAGGMMGLMMAAIGGYVGVLLAVRFLRCLPKKLMNLLHKIKAWFEWSGLLRFWITSYLSLSVAACLQVHALDFSSNIRMVSSVLGLFVFFANLGLPIMLYKIIDKNEFNHKKLKVKYSSLVEEYLVAYCAILYYNLAWKKDD